ncbi:3-deoxy-D-manno-octulosonic acid transferase [Algibacillus agarilyticus]|uniref:3-deoxy-D-manno-octulosonic acid transferase n=1 Tax=Algibacillus agarilyticus TaxID=2234133 RepID=UPI001300B3FA|nr:3-deoxy-D-manno-octulosonic acid transferase [Algibacillus agarilyticus]
MNRFFYSAFLYLIFPLVLVYFIKRGLKDSRYFRGFFQRLGFFKFENATQVIHFHCASLGESKAATPLIKAVKKAFPSTTIVVTNTTPAGSAEIRRAFSSHDVTQLLAPLDFLGAVKRFCHRVNPSVSIFVEVELWPNWFAALAKNNTPCMIVNGRMTEKSYKKYSAKPALFDPLFSQLHWVGAQSSNEADRYKWLNVPKVEVMGNMKFELAVSAHLDHEQKALSHLVETPRKIWMAASVHPVEYQQVIKAHQLLLQTQPDALLLLMPRHSERFGEVARYLANENINFKTRSSGESVASNDCIWLLDSMGEAMPFYQLASVAYVGGSLVDIGGHNPLEPAILSKPILMGPYYGNCVEIAEALNAEQALQFVHNEGELAEHLEILFSNPSLIETGGEAGLQFVKHNQGAVDRCLQEVKSLLAR